MKVLVVHHLAAVLLKKSNEISINEPLIKMKVL